MINPCRALVRVPTERTRDLLSTCPQSVRVMRHPCAHRAYMRWRAPKYMVPLVDPRHTIKLLGQRWTIARSLKLVSCRPEVVAGDVYDLAGRQVLVRVCTPHACYRYRCIFILHYLYVFVCTSHGFALVALFSRIDSHLLSHSTHSFMSLGNVDKGRNS